MSADQALIIAITILAGIAILSALWTYLPNSGPLSGIEEGLLTVVGLLPILIPLGVIAIIAKLRSMS